MRRTRTIGLIVAGVVVFLVISALLARALSVGSAEEAAITTLVHDEARGDTAAVIAAIQGCRADPSCRVRAATVSAALRHPGQVTILQILPSANFSVVSSRGTARVAWLVGNSLPRVQCLRVEHAGNVLTGFTIKLDEVSRRIPSGTDCPARF